jgi:hypothetical protein
MNPALFLGATIIIQWLIQGVNNYFLSSSVFNIFCLYQYADIKMLAIGGEPQYRDY